MLGIIAAVSPEWVIGKDGAIPWHYPKDLARFKRLTLEKTVVMGRNTFESIGRPLPKRRNVVITSRSLEGMECFGSIRDALRTATTDVWFIGGRAIYAEALLLSDTPDLTFVPDHVDGPGIVRFPTFDLTEWIAGPREPFADDTRLAQCTYRRRAPLEL